jgi:hypothetical protein
MTVQNADLFHCLACGRVAYEPHGGAAPDCCGQPMVRAVADVVKEVSASTSRRSGLRGDVEEHALLAEAVELAQWCHGLQDVDISRSDELANRMSALHQALIDQVEDSQRRGAPVQSPPDNPAAQIVAERMPEQGQQLLATFARFVAQLRGGPSPFGDWAQICDRLDELVVEFRHYVQAEGKFSSALSANRDGSAR